MSRCPSCMREIKGKECPHCGYPSDGRSGSRFALPIGTRLADRYVLGQVLTGSYQSMAYVAHDQKKDQVVVITELFPKNLAGRAGTRVGVRKNHELFAQAVQAYMKAQLAVSYQLQDAFTENETAYRAYILPGGAEDAAAAADELLDHPVYFRDQQGKPLMSVNCLVIPELPPVRQFRRSEPLPNDDHNLLGLQPAEPTGPRNNGATPPAEQVPPAAGDAAAVKPLAPAMAASSPVSSGLQETADRTEQRPPVPATAAGPDGSKKKTIIILAVVVLLLLAGIAVTAVVTVKHRKEQKSAGSTPSVTVQAGSDIVTPTSLTDISQDR